MHCLIILYTVIIGSVLTEDQEFEVEMLILWTNFCGFFIDIINPLHLSSAILHASLCNSLDQTDASFYLSHV